MPLMMGRRIALMMPKMTATASSVPILPGIESVLSLIPWMTSVEIHSETAVIRSRMRMPMAPDRAMAAPVPAATLRDLIGVDVRAGRRAGQARTGGPISWASIGV
jgi:hypothetical protein